MRLRNRRALQDKTPGNSPQPSKIQTSVSKPAPAVKLTTVKNNKPQLPTPDEDVGEDLIMSDSAIIEETSSAYGRELSLSPLAAASQRKARPIHSTPLVLQRKTAPKPPPPPQTQKPSSAVPPTPQPARGSSPLPPSSPPSDFEFRAHKRRFAGPSGIGAPPAKGDPGGGLKVYNDPEVAEVAEGKRAAISLKRTSSDDPFGLLAVERKLRAQREKKQRPKPSSTAAPSIPFRVLARASPEPEPEPELQPVAHLRSDDDDLYMDFPLVGETEADKENVPLPANSDDTVEKVEMAVGSGSDEEDIVMGHGGEEEDGDDRFAYVLSSDLNPRVRDMDDDDEIPHRRHKKHVEDRLHVSQLVESETDNEYDPLRTPRHTHVSKRLYPLESPFSSRGTPCDPDLAIDSAPSSPSPSKPMEVITPLRHPPIRPAGKLSELRFKEGLSSGKRKMVAESDPVGSTAKKARVDSKGGSDMAEEPPSMAAESSPTKRPLRRSTRNLTSRPAPGPSKSAPARKTRSAAKRKDRDGNETESESEDERPPKSKAKAKAKAKASTSRTKASATGPGTTRGGGGGGRKPASYTGRQSRNQTAAAVGRDKGKGRVEEVESDDEETSKARKARVEYFKKLDSDYKLAKENVYVV